MAVDYLFDGSFFAVSNDVIEALYSSEALNKNHIRLVLYVARMTWAWKRQFFLFRQADAVRATEINPSNLSKAFRQLIDADILATQKGEVGINQNVSEWRFESLVGNSPTSWQNANKSLAKRQQRVGKTPTTTGCKSANDAAPGDPKNNIKKKKNNIRRKPDSAPVDSWFSQAWEAYPRRAGTNSKSAAASAWSARIKEGVSPEAMFEAVKRYASFCDATGKTGSEYVLQAASFFGPQKRGWEGNWEIPPHLRPKEQKPVDDGSQYEEGSPEWIAWRRSKVRFA